VSDDLKKKQEEINRQIDEVYSRLESLGDSDNEVSGELIELQKQRNR